MVGLALRRCQEGKPKVYRGTGYPNKVSQQGRVCSNASRREYGGSQVKEHVARPHVLRGPGHNNKEE